jgi:hypothetical protein
VRRCPLLETAPLRRPLRPIHNRQRCHVQADRQDVAATVNVMLKVCCQCVPFAKQEKREAASKVQWSPFP